MFRLENGNYELTKDEQQKYTRWLIQNSKECR